ncbi:MAG: hypothetical protein ACXVAF_14900 [Vulcanimicrobiaceae bacterium]
MRMLLLPALLLLLRSAAQADDFGPQRDITSIRADVPVLLGRLFYERNYSPSQVVVSDIVVIGNDALANWHIGPHDGLIAMQRIGSVWWDLLEGYSDDTEAHPGHQAWWFEGASPWQARPYYESYFGPTSAKLREIGLPKNLIAVSAGHNPAIAAADRAEDAYIIEERTKGGSLAVPSVYREEMYLPANVTQNGSSHGGNRVETGGYEVVLVLAPNNSAGTAVSLHVARPQNRGVLALSLSFTAPRSATFADGSRLNVWFPYVLDTAKDYVLVSNAFGTVNADLHDNTLSFDLPAFDASPGSTFTGEIVAR